MNLAVKERVVVATLLTEFPVELPPNCARVLHDAPESFDDLRLGNIAVAIRQLREAGKPVAPITVREQLNGKLDEAGGACFLDALAREAVPIVIAEFEAATIWESYRKRRLKALYVDAASAMEATPDKADSIVDGVKSALAALGTEHSTKVGLTIRKPDELLAMTFDDSDRILGDRLLATGQSLVIAGAGALGKSRLLLQLAVATISGREFVSFETRRPDLRWLILQAENSNRRLQADLAALREWTGKEWRRVNNQLLIHTLETDADGLLSLDSDQALRRIADAIAKTKPDIIGWDSLYNFAAGDLNKDEDMTRTLLTIARLTRAQNPDRAPVVIHHARTGRAGAAGATGYDRSSHGRNSKVLFAWTRAQLNIAPGSPENNDLLVLSSGKCSNGREFAPFAIRFNPDTGIYEIAPDFDLVEWQRQMSGTESKGAPDTPPERVRELCEGAMTKAQLARAIMADCGCARSSAYRRMEKAEKAKTIRWNKISDTYVTR